MAMAYLAIISDWLMPSADITIPLSIVYPYAQDRKQCQLGTRVTTNNLCGIPAYVPPVGFGDAAGPDVAAVRKIFSKKGIELNYVSNIAMCMEMNLNLHKLSHLLNNN